MCVYVNVKVKDEMCVRVCVFFYYYGMCIMLNYVQYGVRRYFKYIMELRSYNKNNCINMMYKTKTTRNKIQLSNLKIIAWIRVIAIHPGVRDSISNPLTEVKGRRVNSLTYPLSLSEYVEKTHYVGFRPAKLLISKDVVPNMTILLQV